MRKNAQKVLIAFSEGKSLTEGTISTNGKELFSYTMLIARKNDKDGIEILEYHCAPSNTTRSHIRAVVSFFAAATIDARVESFE